jgi:hypothetical protein
MMTKLMYLAKHNLLVPLYGNNFMDHDDPKTRVCALYLELLAKVSCQGYTYPNSDYSHPKPVWNYTRNVGSTYPIVEEHLKRLQNAILKISSECMLAIAKHGKKQIVNKLEQRVPIKDVVNMEWRLMEKAKFRNNMISKVTGGTKKSKVWLIEPSFMIAQGSLRTEHQEMMVEKDGELQCWVAN